MTTTVRAADEPTLPAEAPGPLAAALAQPTARPHIEVEIPASAHPYDVAVVIPCHNAAAHLHGAIRSALEQSHPPSTILVVDDGSTDESVAIALSYTARGDPVRCLELGTNRGPAAARNIAISHITEPFVAFLDADDRWTERHCEHLLASLVAHPEADLAFACTRPEDPRLAGSTLPVPPGRPVEMLEHLLNDNFIPQSAVLARRRSILDAGGYTESMRFSEDYELWLRMAHGHRFIGSAEQTCIRTSHVGQASQYAARMYRGAWEARTRFAEFAAGCESTSIAPERYESVCATAYDRNVAEAWQSRSFGLLRSVLSLADVVPGGRPIRRRWVLRAIPLWPAWRIAAGCWDSLPEGLRARLRAARRRSPASSVAFPDAPATARTPDYRPGFADVPGAAEADSRNGRHPLPRSAAHLPPRRSLRHASTRSPDSLARPSDS